MQTSKTITTNWRTMWMWLPWLKKSWIKLKILNSYFLNRIHILVPTKIPTALIINIGTRYWPIFSSICYPISKHLIIWLNVWPFSQSSSVFSQRIFGYSSMILPFVMTFTKTVIMPKAMSDSILTFFSMFWQCITTELVSFKLHLIRTVNSKK